MKETKEIITVPTKDLVVDGVYKTYKNNLVKIISIKDNKLHLYDITECCNIYEINIEKHTLVKRIR